MIFDAYVDPRQATAELSGIAARAGDMKGPFAAIRELMFAGFGENWNSRGALFGRSWPALSPATLARKSRMGEGSETLVRAGSGALQEALTGSAGSTGRVTVSTVRAGVSGRSLFYARFAQAGASGDNRRGTEPARPIVGISRRTQAEATTIIREYLMGLRR